MWAQPAGSTGQNLSRQIQALVREARCYPPEREPRIVRDVFECCRHFPGLRPKLEYCVFDSNQTVRLLALDGVIPILYRNVTYQIPVCIWCMPHYPNEAPVPYVRPTPSMVIRERHSCVDMEGRVYLPYLSSWDPTLCTFYGVAVAMTRTFSNEPPVNARPTGGTSASAEEPERRQLIAQLSRRLEARLADVNEEAVQDIGKLLHDKEELMRMDKSATEEMRQRATVHKAAKDELRTRRGRLGELEEWVKSIGGAGVKEREVDEMVRCKEVRDEQVMQCVAEDSACTDAMDQVDEALVRGVVDNEAYIKEIRRISSRQFYPRALRRKIELSVAGQKGPGDGDSGVRRLKSSRIAPMYAM